MAKRVFKRTTKKGTSVKTTYVPKRNQSKKVKNFDYTSRDFRNGKATGKRSKKYVVVVTTKKVFKSAKAAAKYRMSQTKKGKK